MVDCTLSLKQLKMKLLTIFTLFAIFFISSPVLSQNKDEMAESSVKTQTAFDALMLSKTFEFVAKTVFPSGLSPKDLSGSNDSITFTPEVIASHLPFYGTGHSGMALTRDRGMRFKGVPEDFAVEKTERGYVVSAKVRDENDVFSISLTVSNSQTATLNISTNNRSSISYYGEVK